MYLGLIFLILFSNLYYVSYTETILTNHFFSAMNFFTGLMIINKYRNNLLLVFLGISLGVIWSLKSIGPVITIMALIYIFFFQKSKINIRNLFSLIFPLLVIITLESFLFFKHHDDRKSVFYNIVIGKIFLTSGKNSFEVENYPAKFHNVLKSSKSYYTDVNDFLINIKNPILRSEFSADYEVHAVCFSRRNRNK